MPNLKIFVAFVNQEANRKELEPFIEKWKDQVDQIAILGLLTDNNTYKDHLFEIPDSKPCEYLWDEVDILPTGDVVPCCKIVGELDKFEPSAISFGSLNELTLGEIWRGKKFKEYRLKMAQQKANELEFCKGCEMWQRNFFKYKVDDSGLWKYSVTDQTLINKPLSTKTVRWR